MSNKTHDRLDALLDVMSKLRHPHNGCPWDLEQNYRSIVPHTLEEVYEVVDAIEREDYDDLRDELGDLLFQIVFYTELAREENRFDFMDVAGAITDKLVRRHPHVFEATDKQLTSAEQTQAWERKKAEERAEKAKDNAVATRILDDIPRAMPAIMRALKIQKRVAGSGFEWPTKDDALAKIAEELDEIRALEDPDDATNNPAAVRDSGVPDGLAEGLTADRLTEEFGDLLFSAVNGARMFGVDPERALRLANEKFCRRFDYLETRVKGEGRELTHLSHDQLERLWSECKTDLDAPGRNPKRSEIQPRQR